MISKIFQSQKRRAIKRGAVWEEWMNYYFLHFSHTGSVFASKVIVTPEE